MDLHLNTAAIIAWLPKFEVKRRFIFKIASVKYS